MHGDGTRLTAMLTVVRRLRNSKQIARACQQTLGGQLCLGTPQYV